jgi:D-ribulokinase
MYGLGIDFGTSGARAIAITPDHQIVAHAQCPYPDQPSALAVLWQQSLSQVLDALPQAVRGAVGAIAINGTSGTVLLCNAQGQPVSEPLLYNDDRGRFAIRAMQHQLLNSAAMSATSSLAKALWWHQTLDPTTLSQASHLMHQADWLSFLLHGQLGSSDYHNALKLGYDVVQLAYPQALLNSAVAHWLPQVVAPGATIATILPDIAHRFGFPTDCLIKAGTTDSIAAFLASGARHPGEAVTSLGSTLVLKLLGPTYLEDAARGIYSHRFGKLWLVGGASNTGGAVLRHFFCDRELSRLSQTIDPQQDTELNYYPLLKPGERFPINDADYPPRLEPRPDQPAIFLQGLLEGIARIESQGYQALQTLGAPPLAQVYTAGGGAQNTVWQAIRARYLGVNVCKAAQTQAAYGSARLAQGLSLDIEKP